jgi:hypothetical protein
MHIDKNMTITRRVEHSGCGTNSRGSNPAGKPKGASMGQRGPPSAGFGVRAVDDEDDGPPDWSAIMLPDYRPTPAQAQRQAAARAAGYQPVTDEEVIVYHTPSFTANLGGKGKHGWHPRMVVAVRLCAFQVLSESRS